MNKKQSTNPRASIEIFLHHTPTSLGHHLERAIEEEFPSYEIRHHHVSDAQFRGRPKRYPKPKAKAKSAPDILQVIHTVHNIYIFIKAQPISSKVADCAELELTRQGINRLWRSVKKWAKSRSDKHTYRVALYGPDNEPIKAEEIKNGTTQRMSDYILARTRKRGNKLKR